MRIAVITILTYVQSASTIHENLNFKNSTVLTHPVKVPKCCNDGSVITSGGCIEDTEHEFSPSVSVLIHNSTHVNDEPVTVPAFDQFIQNINCVMGSYPLLPEEDNFYLLENGSLIITDQHKLLSPTEFCFESVDVGEEMEKWITTPFVCVPLPQSNNSIILLIIYATGLTISCIALIVLCVIFGCVVNKLQAKKYVMLYSISLIGCYVIVAVAQIIHPTAYMCDLLGTLFQLCLIAAVGCLSLIAADTYCTVRKYAGNRETLFESHLQLTIILLSAAFMLITICLALMDNISVPRTFLKPQLGQNFCWCTGEKSTAFYFTLPVIAQIIANVVILILSLICIKKSDYRYSKNAEWELLKEVHIACIGMLIIMVLCWLVEISTLMLESKKGISVAVDVIESAQGFIVLLIFAKLAKNDIRQWWHYNFCAGLQRYDSSQNTSDTSIEPIA